MNNNNLNEEEQKILDEIEEEDLNTEEKKGFFKKLWNKTIFPDMIKDKREEKRIKTEILREAKKEALKELKPALKEILKKKELDRLTGKSKNNILTKLGNEFAEIGKGMNGDKIGNIMGQVPKQQTHQPIKYKKKKKGKQRYYISQPQKTDQELFEDKMKRLLK